MTDELLESYRILELEPGASPEAVKQAYRDLAKIWHPDRFPNDPRVQEKAQEKLKAINQAYEHLKNHRPERTAAPASRSGRSERAKHSAPVQPHYDETYAPQDGKKIVLQVIGGMVGLVLICVFILYSAEFHDQQSAQEAKVWNDKMIAKRQLAEVEVMRERAARHAAAVEQTRQKVELQRDRNEEALRAFYASQTNSRWHVFAEYEQATAQAIKQTEANLKARTSKVASPSIPGEDQYRRGSDYANGRGVPQDYREAVKCYRAAAELGHPAAQLYLGFHYFAGRGAPKDYVEAYKWFALAARQGDEQAINTLDNFHQFMTAAQLEAGRHAVDEFRAAQSQPVSKP